MEPMAEALKGGFQMAHMITEGTMEGLTPEQAHWQPGGTAHNIASTYAHLVMGEDMLVNMTIGGGQMLAMSSWAGKTGFGTPPHEGDWAEWARSTQFDLPALREYAKAVYAATEAALNAATAELLARPTTLPFEGFGTPPAAAVFGMTIGHLNNHTGEIAAIKGIQGLQGYPF